MPTSETADRLHLILVSGLSGSGKSTATNALEDLGYFCVDNLPLPLLRTFLTEPRDQVGELRRVAVVSDVRAPGFADALPDLVEQLARPVDYALSVVFFEASEDTLVRRYSETRRCHPLGDGDRPVVDGIRREIRLLAPLRQIADRIVDTSGWSVHDVRREMVREFADAEDGERRLAVSIFSFGFKHGVPNACDLLFDVRFLDNPHFRPGLRERTGLEPEVQDFLDQDKDFEPMLERLEDLLRFLLPRYDQENRSYLSIAIGCTGGRHRSVATTERLSKRLERRGWSVRVHHRDIER